MGNILEELKNDLLGDTEPPIDRDDPLAALFFDNEYDAQPSINIPHFTISSGSYNISDLSYDLDREVYRLFDGADNVVTLVQLIDKLLDQIEKEKVELRGNEIKRIEKLKNIREKFVGYQQELFDILEKGLENMDKEDFSIMLQIVYAKLSWKEKLGLCAYLVKNNDFTNLQKVFKAEDFPQNVLIDEKYGPMLGAILNYLDMQKSKKDKNLLPILDAVEHNYDIYKNSEKVDELAKKYDRNKLQLLVSEGIKNVSFEGNRKYGFVRLLIEILNKSNSLDLILNKKFFNYLYLTSYKQKVIEKLLDYDVENLDKYDFIVSVIDEIDRYNEKTDFQEDLLKKYFEKYPKN